MEQSANKLCLVTIERPEPSDEDLIAEVLSGDDARFEEIFLRHRRRVVHIAARFFNRQMVEEVSQEVFAKAFFALADYSKERGPSFAAWISRIAINTCYDELRRARRRPEGNLGGIQGEDAQLITESLQERRGNAEAQAISRDLAEKLLSKLSADDRLILTLLDGEEMPVSEIARALGWGVSRVKVRAHRARAALRRVVADFI
jgi:RNA polymerase sigma-70 factor (ECF subfamily)